MCSLWPTVVNTAVGVRAIPQDYINVARVLRLSPRKLFTRILLPATLPQMFTGFRLSLGIAWLVIVAAEMLSGKNGIGAFVNNQYQSGTYGPMIAAVILIGFVGFILDRLMTLCEQNAHAIIGFMIQLQRRCLQSSVAVELERLSQAPRKRSLLPLIRKRPHMPLLEVRNVNKGFGKGVLRNEVLTNISVDIHRGEFVAVLGYSGSGKSTLISLLSGLQKPDSGQITFAGSPVKAPGPDRGVVFQNYSLLPG